MPTTAKSVHNRRKIEMGVPKLSILGALKRTCFTSVRNMGLRNDDEHLLYRFSMWFMLFDVAG